MPFYGLSHRWSVSWLSALLTCIPSFHLNSGPLRISYFFASSPGHALYILSSILSCFQCQSPWGYLVWESAGNRSFWSLFRVLSPWLPSVEGWNIHLALSRPFYSPRWEKKSWAFKKTEIFVNISYTKVRLRLCEVLKMSKRVVLRPHSLHSPERSHSLGG